MNLSKFLFKFFVILTYILRVGLLILPVALVGVLTKEGGWKYGFTFIQNNIDVALFISFSIGFLIALYHAVSFEEIEDAPDENYMKSSQTVKVSGKKSLDDIAIFLNGKIKYRNVNMTSNSISARKKVHLVSADKVNVQKEGEVFLISSSPFAKWWFIDFGRNYKNVKEIAEFIKLG